MGNYPHILSQFGTQKAKNRLILSLYRDEIRGKAEGRRGKNIPFLRALQVV